VGVRSQLGAGSVFFAVLPIKFPTDSAALRPAINGNMKTQDTALAGGNRSARPVEAVLPR